MKSTIPSGKQIKTDGISPFFMAKSILFMAIFNSCLYVYQGVTNGFPGFSMVFHVFPGGNLGIPNEKSTDFAMISRCLRTVRASSVACLGSAEIIPELPVTP